MTIAQKAIIDRIAVGERRVMIRLIAEVSYCSPEMSYGVLQSAIMNLVSSGHLALSDRLLVERVK